eukprot:CAMPEP_0117671382 /NCGR_PEP_ID=MMETSP0804-20121206/13302_1 /TAXON_ID=1074897 /ORGANISM="Tetraselmis astigmatica, Strain CCMP880" /LENGTH=620 /DNA_ID=CAMNT_0005479835 /DNA_START=81 /DNA_END=1943 /DNA_ORIENTATION=+
MMTALGSSHLPALLNSSRTRGPLSSRPAVPSNSRASAAILWGRRAFPLPPMASAAAPADETTKPEKAAAASAPKKPAPLTPEEYVGLKVCDGLRDEYSTYWPAKSAKRQAGIILHPTSLPGAYGTGEIGKYAMAFVDWAASAGFTLWQVLPLVPPEEEFWSPYSSTDANAGNTLMIAVEELVEMGLISKADLPAPQAVGPADFAAVQQWKVPLLKKAAKELLTGAKCAALREDLEAFKKENPWVFDSALFDVLSRSEELDKMLWWDWPEGLRDRDPAALKEAEAKFADEIDIYVVLQFLFDHQWKALRAYANGKGVGLLGDMPIYVSGHSVDVWANQKFFSLAEDKKPGLVSGVPPDAFSETGQLWGTPLYDWEVHAQENYAWWVGRLTRAFSLYDECRIDHFRAFAGYWAIPGDAETAMTGTWKKGPGVELFQALEEQMGHVPIVAEDLGVITRDVVELREAIQAPGMVVLQFAWEGGSGNTHLPHNHYSNSFCYPGTHDNETAVGWYRDTASDKAKAYLAKYLRARDIGPDGTGVNWVLIEAAMASVSRSTLVLLQDIMGQDNVDGRMNTPGRAEGNWAWRAGEADVWERLAPEAKRLAALVKDFDRAPEEEEEEEAA